MKILVIEDDDDIVNTIALTFQVGWPVAEIITAQEGNRGIEMVKIEAPDMVILDLGLPDINGFEVLNQLRTFSSVPVIILTAMVDIVNIVKGLEWGADDYIAKPFNMMELLARVKAILRRKRSFGEETPLFCGHLSYDPASRKFHYYDREIGLTITETSILCHLMKNAGLVVTYSSLAEVIWGTDYPGANDAIRVHIQHIREKFEADPGHPQLILTKPNIGYSLVKPE